MTGFENEVPSTPEDVRGLLDGVRDALAARGRADEASWEIVLAEVLNNIVEHAYCERPDGRIALSVNFGTDAQHVTIVDQGQAFPDLSLPAGELTSLDVAREDLPEGGFGWFLIRSLTQNLEYVRKDNSNWLSFSIPYEYAAH